MADFMERNSSPKAARRIRKLAKTSGIPFSVAHGLVSSVWNFDDDMWLWVREYLAPPTDVVAELEAFLGLNRNFRIARAEMIADVEERLGQSELLHLSQSAFVDAVSRGDFWAASPYGTLLVMRGLKSDNAVYCDSLESMDFWKVCSLAGLKLARGGAMDHSKLDYAWVDLHTAGSISPMSVRDAWPAELRSRVDDLSAHRGTLSALKKCCKGLFPANMRQLVLETLAYAGALEVVGFDRSVDFIPAKRHELSSHFYKNDSNYPLRMWNSDGKTQSVSGLW